MNTGERSLARPRFCSGLSLWFALSTWERSITYTASFHPWDNPRGRCYHPHFTVGKTEVKWLAQGLTGTWLQGSVRVNLVARSTASASGCSSLSSPTELGDPRVERPRCEPTRGNTGAHLRCLSPGCCPQSSAFAGRQRLELASGLMHVASPPRPRGLQ